MKNSECFKFFNSCAILFITASILCLASINLFAQFDESDTFNGSQTFESGVPSTWKTYGGGSVLTTGLRYKQGSKSLLWNWSAGSKIIVTDSELKDISREKNGGIEFWIYSEQNIGDSIRFDFFNTLNQVECSFPNIFKEPNGLLDIARISI